MGSASRTVSFSILKELDSELLGFSPPCAHFPSSSSISGDTTFSPLPGKSLSLFLSWSLSSKESSVVNGLFEALQLLVLSLRSVRVNKSGQFLSYFDLNCTHTIQLSVTSLHLQRWIAPNGSSPNLSNIDSPILIYTRSSIFTDDFRFPRIDDLLSPRLLTRDNPIDPRRSSHERK